MVRVVLAIARHGDYEQPAGVPSAHLLHPLTPLGREQARELGRSVAELAAAQGCVSSARVAASPLLRAYQTARIAADVLQQLTGRSFEVATHPALAERSLGAAANLDMDQIARLYALDERFTEPLPADWKSRSDYRLPWLGAESLDEAGERTAAQLRALCIGLAHAESDSLQLVVGHGAALRHAARVLGLLSRARVRELSMHHARPILLEWDGERFVHLSGEWKQRGAARASMD